MKRFKNIRPIWIVIALLLLVSIGWAVANLSGQANKSAADAGESSQDMEMASIDMIKPSQKSPPCNWALEKKLRNELASIDKAYSTIVAKAKSEVSANGAVTAPTQKQLLDSAHKFKNTSDKYAEMWSLCNCTSRAKLASETGITRVASAEVIASGADSDKASALKAQQDRLNTARNAYTKEASENDELSATDKAAIKKSVLPRAEKLVSNATGLVGEITSLLNNIRSQASPAGLIGGVGGCAAKQGAGDPNAAEDSVAGLISPVTSLLSLAEGLLTNAKSLVSDATTLSE